MKHLLRFKLFENSDHLIDDIKERLFDISDKGNQVKVDWVDTRYKDELVIVIKNETGDLEANTFISLFSMMKSEGFNPKPISLWNDNEMDRIYPMKWKEDWGLSDEIEVINSFLGIEVIFEKNINI